MNEATHMTDKQLAKDIAELMNGWNKIEEEAKKQFPNASKEEIQRIATGAMNHALGIK